MKHILFACDLDNTLIHSHKKKQEGDICAELLEGREQSFLTSRAAGLLQEISRHERICLLPVTTRSIAQYLRIQWPEGCVPELALVCNGAILLRNGIPDPEWLAESDRMIAPFREELEQLRRKYSGNPAFKTVRIVDDMFLFLYCHDREALPELAASCRQDTALAVEYTGSKMYIFPDPANKGHSVRRFAAGFGAGYILAAGDSMIDCPMLETADMALVPNEEMAGQLHHDHIQTCSPDERFSDFILQYAAGLH